MTKVLEPVTILDENGVEHAYTAFAWPAEEGFLICTQLFALVGPSVGEALAALFAGGSGKVTLASMMSANIDAKALGGAFGQLSAALAQPGNVGLMKRMFRNVKRDGKPLLENGAFGAEFNAAYSGNFGELGEAVVWLIQGNRVADFFVRSVRRLVPKKTAAETSENPPDAENAP